MIPSGLGLINQTCVNLIGSGTVVHIPGFLKELKELEAHGVKTENRLFISDRAHVVLDLHQRVDGLEEAELSGSKIGTTGKGKMTPNTGRNAAGFLQAARLTYLQVSDQPTAPR